MSPPLPRPSLSSPEAEWQAKNELLGGLLAQAAQGDVPAFERLYLLTSRLLLARVRRLVGDSLAEDVLSDAYLQVWRTASSFDPGRGDPVSWLLTIARTRALDRLRTERTCHGGYQAPADDAQPEPGHWVGPEQLLELAQARASVHACLAVLTPKERMVLGLAYFGDLTQTEISSSTGLPLGTVKTVMTRSQQKLRAQLQPVQDMASSTAIIPSPLLSAAS